ncbi:hypothetical protein CICLE_v10026900mg [Citrus x clementina]|uniref:Uncharacterized protein n=1 Tax=Citrus clementina TaxID=85681 RepID=V4SQE0_CITCL|nr:hypothetical protein CICLE_v10026900mg [Citrus x clementina]
MSYDSSVHHPSSYSHHGHTLRQWVHLELYSFLFFFFSRQTLYSSDSRVLREALIEKDKKIKKNIYSSKF